MNAYIDISGIRIETERLILRPWSQDDLEDFYTYAGEPGVGEMAGWTHHESREETQRILDSFIRHKKTFALELKESGQVIGSLGIEELNPDEFDIPEWKGRELGYVLGKNWWGMGLMPEAVRAVAECCFDRLGCDFLTCAHFLPNARSRRVIEKCGFRYVKEFSYTTSRGTKEASLMYVLYHSESKR